MDVEGMSVDVCDFPNICRTCCQVRPSENLTSIFTLEGQVLDLLLVCTALEVNPHDGLPRNICQECNCEVVRLQTFVKQCQFAEKRLRSAALRVECESKSSIKTNEDNGNSIQLQELEGLVDSYNIKALAMKKRMKVCEVCLKSVPAKHIAVHMRVHTKEKPYSCSVCQRQFTKSANLLRHIKIHTGDKPHVCHICNKAHIQKVALVEHLKIHHMDRVVTRRVRKDKGVKRKRKDKEFHPCRQCGQSFESLTLYYAHKETHAEQLKNEPGEYICTICKQTCISQDKLRRHQLVHSERKFLCFICGKRFRMRANLESHYRIHTGERPYSCDLCGKSFAYQCTIDKHMLTHSNEYPHQCPTCKKAFKQRAHLNTHMRTHTGERPYVCSDCGKAFAMRGNLIVHIRRHTGEMPFVCTICGKGYYDSSSLRKHCRGHNDVEQVQGNSN